MNPENINTDPNLDYKSQEPRTAEQKLGLYLGNLNPQKKMVLEQALNKANAFEYSLEEFVRQFNMIDDQEPKDKIFSLLEDFLRSSDESNSKEVVKEMAEIFNTY